jgi:hypothetical protein
MGLRALKTTPQYAAFRRWRTRLREALHRLARRLDAWTGGRRLRRAEVQAILEAQALELRALGELTGRVQALEAEVARLRGSAGRS